MSEDKKFVVPEEKGGPPLGGLRSKDGKFAKLIDTPIKKIGAVALGVLLVVAVCYGRYCWLGNSWPRTSHGNYASQPQLIMTTSEWRGIGTPPGKRINAWPIVPNVSYMVRLDKDPNQVHSMSPNNGPEKGLIDIGHSRFVEWRLCPGQSVTQCEVVYEIQDL